MGNNISYTQDEQKFLDGYDEHQAPIRFKKEKTTPILFLDFDGVLNGLNYWYNQGNAGMDLVRHPFDPECIKNANIITGSVECDIVLSTAWRFFGFYYEYIPEILRDSGFVGNVIGDLGEIDEPFEIRGIAIQVWLVNNNALDRNICILDDMHRSKFGWLNGYHVRTDINTGLTEAKAHEAVTMLRGAVKNYGEPRRWAASAKD